MRVVVSGSSGIIGYGLVAGLEKYGNEVVRLVRDPGRARSPDAALWDPEAGNLEPGILDGAVAVINLCGRNIGAGRWTRKTKEKLRASRIGPTRLLATTIAGMESPPPVFINASAVGYYGDRGDDTVDEASPAGSGFLADLCTGWEAEAGRARSDSTRVVTLRLGMVLCAMGALARMLPPFKLGLGGPIGSGRQWWPWVSRDDVVGITRFILNHPEIEGPVNVVAPGEVRCRDFSATLGRALHRPAVIPTPGFAVRALLGEMADALLLASTRVRPGVLARHGYSYKTPDLESALRRALR